jgi:hypothetical protein
MAPEEYHKITLRLEFPFLSEVQTQHRKTEPAALARHETIGR